eukprot:5072163-Pyramimonas_sp.AAC.1
MNNWKAVAQHFHDPEAKILIEMRRQYQCEAGQQLRAHLKARGYRHLHRHTFGQFQMIVDGYPCFFRYRCVHLSGILSSPEAAEVVGASSRSALVERVAQQFRISDCIIAVSI